jgi:hypothetical protein
MHMHPAVTQVHPAAATIPEAAMHGLLQILSVEAKTIATATKKGRSNRGMQRIWCVTSRLVLLAALLLIDSPLRLFRFPVLSLSSIASGYGLRRPNSGTRNWQSWLGKASLDNPHIYDTITDIRITTNLRPSWPRCPPASFDMTKTIAARCFDNENYKEISHYAGSIPCTVGAKTTISTFSFQLVGNNTCRHPVRLGSLKRTVK